MDWEEYVAEIAIDMMKEQSPKKSDSSESFSFTIYNLKDTLNFIISCMFLQVISGAWKGVRIAS